MDSQEQVIDFAKGLPPIYATEQQFYYIFGPLVSGYAWGEDTIGDLWRLGSPQPQDPSARLIIARQYVPWVSDVLNRRGLPLDEAAKLYASFLNSGE